eukprot:tig00000788_g4075.t1
MAARSPVSAGSPAMTTDSWTPDPKAQMQDSSAAPRTASRSPKLVTVDPPSAGSAAAREEGLSSPVCFDEQEEAKPSPKTPIPSPKREAPQITTEVGSKAWGAFELRRAAESLGLQPPPGLRDPEDALGSGLGALDASDALQRVLFARSPPASPAAVCARPARAFPPRRRRRARRRRGRRRRASAPASRRWKLRRAPSPLARRRRRRAASASAAGGAAELAGRVASLRHENEALRARAAREAAASAQLRRRLEAARVADEETEPGSDAALRAAQESNARLALDGSRLRTAADALALRARPSPALLPSPARRSGHPQTTAAGGGAGAGRRRRRRLRPPGPPRRPAPRPARPPPTPRIYPVPLQARLREEEGAGLRIQAHYEGALEDLSARREDALADLRLKAGEVERLTAEASPF